MTVIHLLKYFDDIFEDIDLDEEPTVNNPPLKRISTCFY